MFTWTDISSNSLLKCSHPQRKAILSLTQKTPSFQWIKLNADYQPHTILLIKGSWGLDLNKTFVPFSQGSGNIVEERWKNVRTGRQGKGYQIPSSRNNTAMATTTSQQLCGWTYWHWLHPTVSYGWERGSQILPFTAGLLAMNRFGERGRAGI